MPWFKVEKKTYDTRSLRPFLYGIAIAMTLYDAYENGLGAIPFYDDWGLSEWSLIPTALAYILNYVGIRFTRVKITEMKD